MKFKTKGFLLKEISSDDFCDDFERGCNQGEEVGIDKAFKSFTERVEFYKKYKYAIYGNVQKDLPELYSNWCDYLEDRGEEYERYNEQKFSDWLFDYCFGDIE